MTKTASESPLYQSCRTMTPAEEGRGDFRSCQRFVLPKRDGRYPPNVKYQERFLKAYREARENKRGR